MKTLNLLTLIAANAILMTGCCLTKATIAGDIEASATTSSLASIKPNMTFEFDKCCPDEESKNTVHDIEKLSTDFAKKYLNGEVDADTYTSKHKAIVELLAELKKVCPTITNPSVSSAPTDRTSIWGRMNDFIVKNKF